MQGGEPPHKHGTRPQPRTDGRQRYGDVLQPGAQTDSPGHSLFIGAEGWLILHLVQLVDFMLLQREPNKTMHVSAWKPTAGHKEDFCKGSSSCYSWESNCLPDNHPAELSSNRQQKKNQNQTIKNQSKPQHQSPFIHPIQLPCIFPKTAVTR